MRARGRESAPGSSSILSPRGNSSSLGRRAMSKLGLKRFERELLLTAFSVQTAQLEGWVIDRLITITEERFVRAGDVLWSAGKPVESLYFMRDGRVRMTRPGAAPWTFEGKWFLGSFEG